MAGGSGDPVKTMMSLIERVMTAIQPLDSKGKAIPGGETKKMMLPDLLSASLFQPCCSAASRQITGVDSAAVLESTIKLLKAASIGNATALDVALSEGADPNAVYDPKLMGVLKTDQDIIESQLARQRCNDPGYVFTISDWEAVPLGATALILASRAGHVEVVARLLEEEGLHCNKSTTEVSNDHRNFQTALHWACRQGNLHVVKLLLADSRVEVNPCTKAGFTPFGLAVQQGHLAIVEELLACPRWDMKFQDGHEYFHGGMLQGCGADIEKLRTCDCFDAFQVVIAGGIENRIDVVKRCFQDARVRKWFFDPEIQKIKPEALTEIHLAILADFSNAMLALLLDSGLSPNTLLHGATPLDMAVQKNMIHHIRELLLHDAESTLLSPVSRAQWLGDAPNLRELIVSGISYPDSELPALHRATLQGDDKKAVANVLKEISVLGSPQAARGVYDAGRLPALFYALELGHFKVARVLMERAYGFKKTLADSLIKACMTVKGSRPGERTFRMCYELIDNGSLERAETRSGAMAFVKPWCSSVIATRCLEKSEYFDDFRRLCKSKNDEFYKRVDAKVSTSLLQEAAKIAADVPRDPVRQDDPGVIPHFKIFKVFAQRVSVSADHEACVAQAYAMLGEALEPAFEKDIRQTFENTSLKVTIAAPKSFQRMQNKMLNPVEHGDPQIPRPRCAKNVDVLRGCVSVRNVTELRQAYDSLQSKYKVVRVKNTHDPCSAAWKGGYRSLLVNFIYEPGVTWAQLFGGKVTFDIRDWQRAVAEFKAAPIEEGQNEVGQLWTDHIFGEDFLYDSLKNTFGLQGWQIISSERPDEPVKMIAELQLVLEPYFEGRAVSHLLFKVSRCDTGSLEMVRDFFQEYFHKEAREDKQLMAVKEIALAAREGRPIPSRVDRCPQPGPALTPMPSNKLY
jgi:ankyrin repeat protein